MEKLEFYLLILAAAAVGVCRAQLGPEAECVINTCPPNNGVRPTCLQRPLPAGSTDFDFVCDCSNDFGMIGHDCQSRSPSNPRDNAFFTCYGNECSTGFFLSDGYPGMYRNSWVSLYQLYIPGASSINFEFNPTGGFGIETLKDELYVGTGLAFTFEVLSEANTSRTVFPDGRVVHFFDNMTSMIGPNRVVPEPFSLETDTAFFLFRSDKNLRFAGFNLTWSATVDTQGPTIINCPTNILRSLEVGGIPTVQVDWIPPTANDISPPVTFTTTHPPGSQFGPGQTVVTYTFADRFRNTATCSFTVTITGVDTMPPIVSNCPANIERTIELGSPNPVIFWIEPTATDVGGGEVTVVVRSHPPSSEFVPGTTTVTYVFSDPAGNTADCNFDVIIRTQDTIAPDIINCPDNIFRTVELGTLFLAVDWTEPTSTDISGTNRLDSRSHAPGVDFDVGSTFVEYVFIDASGNSDTCRFLVSITEVDTTPPTVINPPDPITQFIEVDVLGMSVTWELPTFFDASDDVDVVSSHTSGQFFLQGQTTVTYTFTDVTGNSALYSFCINLVPRDTIPPVIDACPPDDTVTIELGQQTGRAFWVVPTATDNSGDVSVIVASHTPGSDFPIGQTTVMYIFADEAGLQASCEFRITVVTIDRIPPVVANCPTTILRTVELGTLTVLIDWVEPTATDTSGTTMVAERTHRPFTEFPVGVTMVTYTFSDASGNSVTCSFIISISTEDTTPPSITGCPVNPVIEFVELGLPGRQVSFDEPTATDLSPPVEVTRSHTPNQFFFVGPTTVTYMFTDSFDNVATCTFEVQVVNRDTIGPEVVCPQDILRVVELGTNGLVLDYPEAQVTDESDTVLISQNPQPNSFFIVGTTLVTIEYADVSNNVGSCSFNIIITTEDNIPPVIENCPGDQTITIELGLELTGQAFWAPPTATDVSGTANLIVESHNPGDDFPIGATTVRYIYSDPSGNSATCSFVITVVTEDTTPPTITNCPDSQTITVELGITAVAVTYSLPTATDNSDTPGPLLLASNTHNSGQDFPLNVTTVRYIFTDPASLSSVCEFNILVTAEDRVPPVISGCPVVIPVNIELGSIGGVVNYTEPTATDLSGIAVISTQTHSPFDFFTVGITEVTYVFVDGSANTALCTFRVIVTEVDRTPPQIINCPDDIVLPYELGVVILRVPWDVPTATDLSGTQRILTESHRPDSFFQTSQVTTVTYVFTDDSDNIATCEFTVSFTPVDTTPPDITGCPSDRPVLIELGTPTGQAFWVIPTATDISGVADIINQPQQPGDAFPVGRTVVSYIFADNAGLTAVCEFAVIVTTEDTTPPVVTSCPDNQELTIELGLSVARAFWTEPTATDVSGVVTVRSQSAFSGDEFPIGTTTVVYVFEDSAGLTAMCVFVITVITEDTEPPTITGCPSLVEELVECSLTGRRVSWTEPTAMDLSGVAIIADQTASPNDFFPIGLTMVTYRFADNSVNSDDSICTFPVMVTAIDTTPPVISGCLVNGIQMPIELGEPGASVNFDLPTANDLCGNANLIDQTCTPGDFFLASQRTTCCYEYADNAGNTARCCFCVELISVDNIAPTILGCPNDFEVLVELGLPGRSVTWIEPTSTDVSGTQRLDSRSNDPDSFFIVGDTVVTYTFIDASLNSAICQFTVTVTPEDTTPPTISDCPEDFTVTVELGETSTTVTWQEPTATDISGTATLDSRSARPNDPLNLGPTQVTYVFVDASNNFATCQFTVIVSTVDTTPPQITGCPSDILRSIELGLSGVNIPWIEPIASDVSDTQILESRTAMPGDFFVVGVTMVTYTYADASLNRAMCNFNIIVTTRDSIPPTITGCPSQDVVQFVELGEFGAVVQFDAPTATDLSEPVDVDASNQPGSFFTVGTATVTYAFTDAVGNEDMCIFNVVVTTVDTTPPVISGCPVIVEAVVELGEAGIGVTWEAPTATDISGEAIIQSVTQDPGSFFEVGDTVVVYIFTDNSGNTEQCEFIVRVTTEDTTPPTILGCPNDIVEVIELGSGDPEVFWVVPIAQDLSETRIASASNSPGQTFPVSVTTVTYIFVDTSGNNAVCSFSVTVMTEDTTPPTITGCPNTAPIEAVVELGQSGRSVSWTEPTATDLSGTVQVDRPDTPGSFFPVGRRTIMYIFSDSSGNNAVCQFIVIVSTEDTIPPVITGCPTVVTQTVELGLSGVVVLWDEPTAMDISEVAILASRSHQPGSFFPVDMTTVTYVFSDDSGNSATCTFTVRVIPVDTTPPEIVGCPDLPLQIIELGLNGGNVEWIEPTANDISGTAMQVSASARPGSFFLAADRTTITYLFSDETGNSATCRFCIEFDFEDTTPPDILRCPTEPVPAIVELGTPVAVVTYDEPLARDNSNSQQLLASQSCTSGDEYPVGETNCLYLFVDPSGNNNQCQFLVIVTTIDTTPPTISNCPLEASAIIELGTPQGRVFWVEPTATDLGGAILEIPRSGNPGDSFNVGMTPVIYRFTDPSGNVAVCSFLVTVTTVDRTQPDCVDIPADITEDTELGSTGTVVSFDAPTCSDISNLVMVTERTHTSPSFFPLGSTDVIYTCTDGSGNSRECVFNVQIIPIDTIRPAILECPGVDAPNVVRQVELGTTSVVVTFPEPSANDASDDVTRTSTCNSGDRFNVGRTDCTYTFTDPSGNSADCQLTVDVQTVDTTAPTLIQCPTVPIVVTVELGITNTPVTFTAPSAFDISTTDPANLLQTQTCTSGNNYPVGETLCLYLFADPSGNSVQCTFMIIVNTEDTTPPTISNCPVEASTVVELGQPQGIVTWTVPTATDLATVTLVSQPQSPGSLFPVGSSTVTYIFEDSSGNRAVCTFPVTVTTIDRIPPTISGCPEDILQLVELGLPGRVINWEPPTATDVSGVVNVEASNDPGFYPPGRITVTYQFTDSSNNRAVCSFIVEIIEVDTTPPEVPNCPDGQTVVVELGLTSGTASWQEPIPTDISGTARVTSMSHMSGTTFVLGDTTVTYVFVDETGNTATCVFCINVVPLDRTPPMCTNLPSEISRIVELGTPGLEVVTLPSPTCADISGTGFVRDQTNNPGDFFIVGNTDVRFTCADESGNTEICLMVVRVTTVDSTPPTISGCPGPQSGVVELGVPFSQLIFWVPPTATDISGAVSLTVNTNNPGDEFPIGMTTVIYTFTDSSSNSETCMFVVTITTEDTVPPNIVNCPDMIGRTVELGIPGLIISWEVPTATDISGTSMLASESNQPNTFYPVGVTQVVYTFRDASGNEAVCAFMIVISTVDTTPPDCVDVPGLVFATTELGSQGMVASWQELTCSDISGIATVTARSQTPPSFFPIGRTEVVYTCTDGAGNSQDCPFFVQIDTVDTIPPAIMQCPGIDAPDVLEIVELGTTSAIVTFTEPSATDLSGAVTASSTCNSGDRYPVGITTCTYSFIDPSNNNDDCSFNIEVRTVDTTPPTVIQCPSQPVVVVVELGTARAPVFYTEPSAFDLSNPPNILQSQTCTSGEQYPVGETNCLYLFVDTSGNNAQCTFLIIVNTEDTTPPTISNCPNEASTVVELGTPTGIVFWTEPSATDLAGASLVPRTGNRPGDFYPVGITEVVYIFEDPSGNRAICSFIVTVTTVDRIPPNIEGCPDNIVRFVELGLAGVRIDWTEPTASDISDVANLVTRTNAPGEFYLVGSTTVLYRFEDSSDNFAECSFEITVIEEDTTPPTIQCPIDVNVIVEVRVGGGTASFALATATDISGAVTVTCSRNSGDFFPTGPTSITCTAEDSSGNENSCTFNIIVTEVDRTPPEVTCPPDIRATVIEGADGAYVDDYEGPVFKSDNSGTSMVTSILPAPGSLFPVGTSPVNIVVSDEAGNTASCSFNIIVDTGNPCDPDPCQNSGKCVIDNINQFQCICPDCYFGDLCQFERNACDNNDCQSGAACVAVDGSCTLYTCACPECFSGDRCQNFQDACSNSDCRNGANCVAGGDCTSYTCSCPSCFQGDFCEQAINPCELASCANGAPCIPDTSVDCAGYRCICNGCFTGIRCDIEIDPCNPSPCRNGAQCSRDTNNCYQYTCECQGCFQGPNCEVSIPNPCIFSPCENGGQCSNLPTTCNAYRCDCPQQFGGFNCETFLVVNRNPCNSFPCEAGATCLPTQSGGYVCLCRDGYAGIDCGQFAASLPLLQLACNSFPCQNGGSCQNSYDSSSSNIVYESQYTCTCPPGFSGTNCQLPIVVNPALNVCAGSDCENGGMCLNTYNSFSVSQIYQCQCPIGFVGQDCEIGAVNPCTSDPCQNGAQCRPFNTYFLCQCVGGFSGTFCQIPPDDSRPFLISCPEDDIVVDALEANDIAPATWLEPRVVSGDQTELLYQSHNSGDLFMGGSTPVTYVYGDLNNQYVCCAFFVVVRGTNRCLGLPCWNGGRCLESGPLMCDCSGTGFGGPTCDDEVTGGPCGPNSCLNGGLCQPDASPRGFRCICPSNFIGSRCEMEVPSCSPNPCQNGGTCIAIPGGVFCTCEAGFQGGNCEERISAGSIAVVNCPLDVAFLMFPDSLNSFAYSWNPEPSASNATGAVTVSQSHQSGNTFNFGTPEQVVYNLTDSAGNSGYCIFTVDFDSVTPFLCRTANPCAANEICSRAADSAEIICSSAVGRKKRHAIDSAVGKRDITDLFKHEAMQCPCMNGGSCIGTDVKSCSCAEGFEGILCEVNTSDAQDITSTEAMSFVIVSFLVIITVILAALTCIVMRLAIWNTRSNGMQKL